MKTWSVHAGTRGHVNPDFIAGSGLVAARSDGGSVDCCLASASSAWQDKGVLGGPSDVLFFLL